MATGIINDLHVKSASINSSTDSKGGLTLYSGTDRLILGIAIDQNYRVSGVVRLNNSNKQFVMVYTVDSTLTYIPQVSTSVTGTYYYIDV